MLFHHSRMFAFDIAALDSLAFIVILFTFTEGDDDFDKFTARKEFCWDDSHAFFFAACKFSELFAMDEQFAWRGVDTACAWITPFVDFETEAGVVEPKLIITNRDVGAFELYVAIASGTYLKAC